MLEHPKRVHSDYPIEDNFDETFEQPTDERFDGQFEDNIARPRFANRYSRQSTPIGVASEDSVPLFLSSESDRRQTDELPPERKSTFSRRTVKAILLIACAAGIIFGLFAIEDTRAVIANAKASLAGELSAGAQQARDPAPVLPPKVQAALGERPSSPAMTAPTREQIVMAYQAALQGQQGQGAAQMPPAQIAQPPQIAQPDPPAAAATPPPVRRLDADELANLLKRAKGLLASGDLSAARLLLARAADAQESEAALLLARSYDPQVLRSSDARTTSPDPERARFWYRKAAEFGSPDAQRRLAEIQK
jgi:TPR repeat protein